MLTVIRSNRVEQLLAELARRLVTEPPASVFTPATVVAASPAMARWINLRIAAVCGMAANIDYPLPAGFVWRLARALLDDAPDADPLSLDHMSWQVFALLPSLLDEPGFQPLRRYLRDDADGRRRWELGVRIADVFDRCQLYRPELIRAWTAGEGSADGGRSPHELWQAVLWQRLVTGHEGRHRVAVLDRLLGMLDPPPLSESASAAVSASAVANLATLPERVALFAVSGLPPILVQVFHGLARHLPVEIYLHTPTKEFWSDLVSEKARARKRIQAPEDAELWEVRNPLLGSWGRQGQALQDLLLDQDSDPAEADAHIERWPPTLLGRLQRDLFELTAVPDLDQRARVEADDSVQVHLCHSPTRECQALHDALLALFQAQPDLRPEDVLVMVPEIGRYAPDIEAVFDRHRPAPTVTEASPSGDEPSPGVPFIPWNLSDIAVADEHPLVRVFLRLLSLPESRFAQSEVLALLDVPELAARFGLGTDGADQVRGWLSAANLRWGLDGAHKARLGLPETAENTWAQAEQRLFGGYALREGAEFGGIAPVAGVEGKAAAALGGFWHLLERLRDWATRLDADRSAADWQRDLGRMTAELLGERDDPDGRLQRIRDAVAELADQASEVPQPLSLALVRQWLEGRLAGNDAERRGGRYFSGGVTFCGMRPMRSLPFQVICVLGLDDDAFPRRDRPVEFDPMRPSWRPGDPRKGDEDRYLFLETLLGARRRLHLSCVGRNIRSNEPRQPSVLLRELLDHIDRYCVRPDGGKLSEAITRVHALQPFSGARFTAPEQMGTEDPRSFDPDWCRVARAVQQVPQAPRATGWPNEPLPTASDGLREVTLTQLERFLAHPLRWFAQTRLKVFLSEEAPEPDEETFALGHLDGWQLRDRLLRDELRDEPQGGAAVVARLSAEGLLPHGALGELGLARQQVRIEPLRDALARYRALQPEQMDVDLAFGGEAGGPTRLSGQVTGIYQDLGLLRWRAGTLRGEDRLRLWLAHLARWAVSDPAESVDADTDSEWQSAVMHAEDGGFVLPRRLAPEQARRHLAGLLALYWQGLHRPLPILPRASWVFAEVWDDRDEAAQQRAWNAARRAWTGNSFQGYGGDGDDAYVRLALRGAGDELLADPFAHAATAAEFQRLALALYAPLLAAGEGR